MLDNEAAKGAYRLKRQWNAVGFLLVFSFLGGCTKRPVLRSVRATLTEVESTVTTISSGTVEAEQQAVLGFGMSGRVGKVFVKAGDTVSKGKTLAKLENREVEIVMEEAHRELSRAGKLFEGGLVSRVALDEAKKLLEIARANFDKCVIRAPFDGLISEMNLDVGELLTAGQPGKVSVRIVDMKPRVVKGDIDEIDLAKVKPGQKARVRIPAARKAEFSATVTRVVPYVKTTREQDRTSQVEMVLADTSHPIPVGASAEVEIVIEAKLQVLALPARVILGGTHERYVYVVEGGRLKKREIQVGSGNYDRMEILSGVNERDTVVYPLENVDLKDGMKVKTEEAVWP